MRTIQQLNCPLLSTRWVIICVTIPVAVLGAQHVVGIVDLGPVAGVTDHWMDGGEPVMVTPPAH
jgi:hypothetical protein